jgi:hypothetical protein
MKTWFRWLRPKTLRLLALKHPSPEDQKSEAMAEAVGLGGAAVEPLAAALHDRDLNWAVRQDVVVALGKIGDKKAIPALAAVLCNPVPVDHRHPDSDREREALIRRMAAQVLGDFGDISVIPFLEKGLKDSDTWVRNAAARALAKTPKRWEPADVKDLVSRARSDPATASEAIEVLTVLVEAGPHLLSADDITSLADLKDVQKDVIGGWNFSTGQGLRIEVDCSRLQALAGQELVRRGLRVVEEPVADKVWLDYKTLTDCTNRVDSIVFCADGSVIAEGGGVQLWNPDTDEKQLLGASGVAMAVSPDRRIVAVARDKAVELWDVRTGHKQKVLEHRSKSSGGFRVWCNASRSPPPTSSRCFPAGFSDSRRLSRPCRRWGQPWVGIGYSPV